MAKSMRSKSKRAFRAKKRTSSTSDYQKTETERLARLSKRLTATTDAAEPSSSSAAMEVDGAATGAEAPSTAPAKVPTHGPRMSGREVWKASKRGIQLRRAPNTIVWHERLAGKAHRRR